MKRYLFAKYLKTLSVEALMDRVAAAGLDGPTALIRDGYWLEEKTLATALPHFITVAAAAGLEVKFASTGFSPEALAQDSTPIKILADHGVRYCRLGYMSRHATQDPRDLADHCRALVETMLKATAAHPVKLLIQLHGCGPHPHSSTAAWPMVRDLPSDRIGIMIDPGNNVMQEGVEDLGYQCGLLRDYIGACGVKDAIKVRVSDYEDGGHRWQSRSVPVGEGFNDWGQVLARLKQVGFDGPLVFMPFYSQDDMEAHCAGLTREVAFVDRIVRRHETKSASA